MHLLMCRSPRVSCGVSIVTVALQVLVSVDAWGQGRTDVPPMRMPREVEHRGRSAVPLSTPDRALPSRDSASGSGTHASAVELGERLLREGDDARAEVLLRQASVDAAQRSGAVKLLWDLHEKRGVAPVDESRIDALARAITGRFARFESANIVMMSDAPVAVANARLGTLERTRTEFIKWARRAGLNPAPEPSKHVCVLFATREGYVAFAAEEDGLDASGIGGHYSPAKERMAMYADASGMAGSDGLIVRAMHEAAHMVAFRTGTQTRRRTQPFWLSEGLASAFEPIGQTVGAPDRLREGLRSSFLEMPEGVRVSIESLIIRDAPAREDTEQVGTMYRTSEALVRYLVRHRSEAFTRYMESLATDSPGRRTAAELRAEFVAHFGEPARVEREMRLRPW